METNMDDIGLLLENSPMTGKRAFPESSSSNAEPDVVEIAPPTTYQNSKTKARRKQKVVEIIDVDNDEDVVFLGGKNVVSSKRMKGKTGFSLDDYVLDDVDDLTLQFLFDNNGTQVAVNSPSQSSSRLASSSASKEKPIDDDNAMKKYRFKKFDTVMDHSDHHFATTQKRKYHQPSNKCSKRIQEEWRILEKDLPDMIFVRAYESRMDLLRAVIIGAEGTPYHDGLFFFDVCFPSTYPDAPPRVHYRSSGLSINPNLYCGGYVCLSLLNTWAGGVNEMWVPGTSTMLQVLVSIQGLILNMKPYFNEPGRECMSRSVQGEKSSLQYNEGIVILTLKTMVYAMNNPPLHFEDLVIEHFKSHVVDILMACKAYTEGVQVGCVVKGGVQNVDDGSNSCSQKLKDDVASYIATLIAAFEKIGAKEAKEFAYLSVKKNPLPDISKVTKTPRAIGYSGITFNSKSKY
ncbi:putative ubiquitin-conjugating enzyme E2 38 [Bidens hawaiensis]|uniref:putative ubiquitin-conjugating enzyme E2 38 n=1 Tax=Bidens hawaiensis TaxID=980011 RepID=UPI00404944B4